MSELVQFYKVIDCNVLEFNIDLILVDKDQYDYEIGNVNILKQPAWMEHPSQWVPLDDENMLNALHERIRTGFYDYEIEKIFHK